MSKEKAKICLESALSEFELYESLGIRDYLKSAYDNMVKALKELEDWTMSEENIKRKIQYALMQVASVCLFCYLWWKDKGDRRQTERTWKSDCQFAWCT